MPDQDVAVELYYDGAWHDITRDDDVFADTPIVITRGDGDESAAMRPTSITLRLANDDDMYRTSNPESPLYGKAGVNTPLRVSVGDVVRGIGEVSSWQAGQTRDFRRYPRRGKAWVDVEAFGLSQRINQWTEPLKSPFRQYNETITQAIGYFHCEQPRGSTGLVSTVPGTRQQGTFSGVAFDSQSRPPSSSPLIDINDEAGVGYYFAGTRSSTSTAGWQLSWVGRYEPLEAGEQTIMYWKTGDGTAYGLYLNPDTGEMLIYSSKGGSPVLAFGSSYSGYDWTQWTMFSIDAQYSGGTTAIWVNWTNADNTTSGFITTSFADVPASLDWWSVLGGSGEIPAGSTMGHVLGVNERSGVAVDLFGADRIEAWTGYLGETASDRFDRVLDGLGLAHASNGTAALSAAMGPQPPATLAEILREIRDTDDAVLFESKTAINFVLTMRNFRYNLTPALTLNVDDDDHGLPTLPVEVTDDLPIHNIVTAAQRDGGEYTVEDSTSPMGSAPPPDGRGEYRQTVDVNVADPTNDLEQQAWWWLYRGTVNLPRFPRVIVNLAALSPSKLAEVEATTIGSVIEITGYREYTIRLHVIGYTETIGTHSRRIEFACAPDQQFDVSVYDTARYDSASTTVKTALSISDTAVTFRTTDSGDVWSTTDTPYDVVIAGQRSRVTSMGAASLVSGAYDQAATVVRGVDGIRKAIAAGEPIRVATPGRYAL